MILLHNVRCVLFDVGNVLLRMDRSRALKEIAFATRKTLEDLESFFQSDGSIVEYQLGWISTETFFRKQKKCLDFPGSWEELKRIWCDIFEPISENIEFARHISKSCRVSLLSNTCEAHVAHFESNYDFFRIFQAATYSFQAGYLKPRPEIFERWLQKIRLKPRECFFVDDREEHVCQAKALGFQGMRVEAGQNLFKLIEC